EALASRVDPASRHGSDLDGRGGGDGDWSGSANEKHGNLLEACAWTRETNRESSEGAGVCLGPMAALARGGSTATRLPAAYRSRVGLLDGRACRRRTGYAGVALNRSQSCCGWFWVYQ